jgi:hypothetical protein
MLPRRRCPFCHRWYHPHPRLKQQQQWLGHASVATMNRYATLDPEDEAKGDRAGKADKFRI